MKDTGIGIEQNNLERIFERFFTTKEGSRGVGLSLVKKAVDQQKGSITVNSVHGKGTVINVLLPKSKYQH